ncbi:Type IV fimbrial biogenesis protein PilY1 [Pseudomonas chlororaphis subsp. aureofaciens]|nr:Type IV fimbrial biogenesis protein PilY1 [Pseudomonas chlororaphis subsp. aureofaciens]
MPSTEARALLAGALLSLYLSAPAYGFTPAQAPLANAAAVAPNVMFLLDDSQSMNSIVYARVSIPGWRGRRYGPAGCRRANAWLEPV